MAVTYATFAHNVGPVPVNAGSRRDRSPFAALASARSLPDGRPSSAPHVSCPQWIVSALVGISEYIHRCCPLFRFCRQCWDYLALSYEVADARPLTWRTPCYIRTHMACRFSRSARYSHPIAPPDDLRFNAIYASSRRTETSPPIERSTSDRWARSPRRQTM
jgi:hypothetical protein